MRRVTVFNLVTLDGYFAGRDGNISWHKVDKEFQELAAEASNSGNTLLFGRVTSGIKRCSTRRHELGHTQAKARSK